jgi:hypothetical protein
LDEWDFAAQTAAAFNAAGYKAVSLADSMAGIEALTDADRIEFLITSVRFPTLANTDPALVQPSPARQAR